jgi:hypothetical protein
MPILQGKSKSEMKEPEDFFKIVGIVPGEELMEPLNETGCQMPPIAAA